MPVDLSAGPGALTVWPFGVHATSGHVEGHRGIDVISVTGTVPVVAPISGEIASIDNAQDSSGGMAVEYGTDSHVHFVTINADCGLQIKLIPVYLDDGIVAGTRVVKGQRLGQLAELIAPFGPGRWSTHFGVEVSTSDPALTSICPTSYFDTTLVTTLTTMLASSDYPEKTARTVSIACDDGSTQSMTYAAEDQLCNPRLTRADRVTLAACLPSRADTIW